MMRFRWRLPIVAAMVSFVVTSGFSCSKKTTEHEPVEYRLYAGVATMNNAMLFVIDAEIDSVIDSIDYPTTSINLVTSSDGKYLGVWGGDPCLRVYEAADLSLLAELGCYLQPVFVPKAGLILASGFYGTQLYDYRTLDAVGQDTLVIYEPIVQYGTVVVHGQIAYGEGHLDSTGHIKYDCQQRKILRAWTRFSRPGGGSYRIVYRYALHPNGRYLYGTTGDDEAPQSLFFCYDLEADSAIFETPIYGPYGDVRVTANGNEVYLTDPGFPLVDYTPGKICIFDAKHGVLLDEISLAGLDTTKPVVRPLYAWDIRFHPSKPKAYIACGGVKAMGPILVIDTEKREIIKRIFPNFYHSIQSLAIGPKP